MLCLHGHPGKGSSMSVFTRALSSRFQTIAPDLRGYGLSQTTQPFEMADHLTDLEALLNQLGIERCLIVGWSLGGILAMELALRFPRRVAGLILVATAARPRSSHPRVGWPDYLNTGIAALVNSLKPGWVPNIELFGKRSLFRYLVQQHTETTYRYLAEEAIPAYLKTSALATQALNQAIARGYNRIPDIAQIQCPCLVLAGESDRHITPESSLETAQALPNSQWQCYQNVAHLFPWEIPHPMMADIQNWLAKNFPNPA